MKKLVMSAFTALVLFTAPSATPDASAAAFHAEGTSYWYCEAEVFYPKPALRIYSSVVSMPDDPQHGSPTLREPWRSHLTGRMGIKPSIVDCHGPFRTEGDANRAIDSAMETDRRQDKRIQTTPWSYSE